jgi:hypothetical protein
MSAQTRAEIIGRRGELLAELFLQDLQPAFVARSTTDFAYDFFLGFANPYGGINISAVQVKATEHPVEARYRIQRSLYDHLAHSSIPALLLIVDVKQNRLFYAWPDMEVADAQRRVTTITIPVLEIDKKVRQELREQLAGETYREPGDRERKRHHLSFVESPAVEVDDASALTQDNWNQEKNARRCELIDREIQGTISPDEKIELEQLQKQMVTDLNTVSPLFIEAARRVHGELLMRKHGQS